MAQNFLLLLGYTRLEKKISENVAALQISQEKYWKLNFLKEKETSPF